MQLQVQGLKKYYSESGIHSGSGANKHLVLDDVNFSFTSEDKGKIKSIIAPYEAGKSTLLKIISAIEPPSEGTVLLNGADYIKSNGSIIYIPEKPSSFPWYNVQENIRFTLRTRGNQFQDSINNIISVVGLAGYEDHFPHNKSLGFRFRISLARALALNPQLILLDDCFRYMESESRSELYALIRRISEDLNVNFLLATANIHEAVVLSSEILLMRKSPGTIFKEINIDAGDYSSDKLIKLRNEIEAFFKNEKIVDSVTFSI